MKIDFCHGQGKASGTCLYPGQGKVRELCDRVCRIWKELEKSEILKFNGCASFQKTVVQADRQSQNVFQTTDISQ